MATWLNGQMGQTWGSANWVVPSKDMLGLFWEGYTRDSWSWTRDGFVVVEKEVKIVPDVDVGVDGLGVAKDVLLIVLESIYVLAECKKFTSKSIYDLI